MLLQLQNIPAAIELEQKWCLFAKFSYVMMDQTLRKKNIFATLQFKNGV